MRITATQTRIITERIQQYLGDSAEIWLFGSRLHENKRGGDVDIYVETSAGVLLNELRCKIELEELLDLPVDLIVRQPGESSPIALIAKTEGVRL